MKKPNQPKTHFVPKIVFEATFAGVMPVCVVASSCGGAVSEGDTDANFGADVAESAFVRFADGVADVTFDRSLSVADGVADAGFRGDVADIAFRDRSLGVADHAFYGDVAVDAFGPDVAEVGFQPPDASDAPATDVDSDAFGGEVADTGFGNPDGETG